MKSRQNGRPRNSSSTPYVHKRWCLNWYSNLRGAETWETWDFQYLCSLHFQPFLDVHVAQGWTDLQIAKWTAKCWNHSPAGHLIAVPNVRCHDFRNLELCWNWPRAPATKDRYHWKLNSIYIYVDYQLCKVICSHIMIERHVWMKFLGISEIHFAFHGLYGSPDTMVGCHS